MKKWGTLLGIIGCVSACESLRVEEFPEAFEEGKEVFTFKTKEELSELVPRILKDTELAKKVGKAGRKRCLAEHTHFHRAKQILKILE